MVTMPEATPLFSSLSNSPHTFLQPSVPLYIDTLAYLKHALDPIATEISNVQHQRRHEFRKKRKRGSRVPEEEVLRLKQIHTQGLTVEQVWEQSRRVIDAVVAEVERDLDSVSVLRDAADGEVALDEEWEDEDGSSLGEEGVDYEVEGVDEDEEEWDEEDGLLDGDVEDLPNMLEDDDIEMDDAGSSLEDNSELSTNEPTEEFKPDKFGLNDGFFSIDDFNRNSEFLEQQDVRGEDDGAASDEEDLDWDVDPLAGPRDGSKDLHAGDQSQDDEEEEDEDDDGGPTFGDPDAPSEDEEDELLGGEMNGVGDMANTNHIMYADFFAPPAQQQQKKRKDKKGRPNPHNFPEQGANGAAHVQEADDKENMERTMAAVHRDLFSDDDEESNSESNDPEQGHPKSNRSTHEKRRLALANEIRQLEAANVAKRSWTLSGEAQASDRPLNSLLEENLDFERAGKPVPVITAEVSESLEALIKRRILAHDFQDIPRRRPDDLATGSGKDGRRGRQEYLLSDERSKKGLAEEYEETHLRLNDPNYVSAQDSKQQAEEQEILQLWKKISTDLDGLSSWHFRPKAPAPTLSILVDAPAVALEDARPSAGGEVAGASQLAPQEVYRAGEAGQAVRSEVVGKSGLPAAREEVGREDKRRRRRREKERARKAGAKKESAVVGGGGEGTGRAKGAATAAEEKKRVLGDLKKGGVGVIGKRGDVTDLQGREVRSAETAVGAGGAGRFKL